MKTEMQQLKENAENQQRKEQLHDTPTHKERAEAYVREKCPELMELSFGCEVQYPSQKRYLEADELDNPQFTKAKVLMYGENRSYDDTEEYFTVFNDWNEEEDLGGKLDEGELEIIGHPIQLQHWLRVLETMPTTPRQFKKKSGLVPYRESTIELCGGGDLEFRIKYQDRCQCSYDCAESYYIYLNFNLTTGQPATPEDYQAFNQIVYGN